MIFGQFNMIHLLPKRSFLCVAHQLPPAPTTAELSLNPAAITNSHPQVLPIFQPINSTQPFPPLILLKHSHTWLFPTHESSQTSHPQILTIPMHESSQTSDPELSQRNRRNINLNFKAPKAASPFRAFFLFFFKLSSNLSRVLLPTFQSHSSCPSLSAQSFHFAWPAPHWYLYPCPSCHPHPHVYAFQAISLTANSTRNSLCLNQPILPIL